MSTGPGMIPPKPIPLKDRASILFVERGRLDVLDGAFVVVDKSGTRTHIPIGGIVCLLLEPGARISHAAVTLAARVGTLLLWVGEAGVRLYSAGQPLGGLVPIASFTRLAWHWILRRASRSCERCTACDSASQPQCVGRWSSSGVSKARVKRTYHLLAEQHGVKWRGRSYDPRRWTVGDLPNRCLSQATTCLYGLAEAAILAAGYAPAIGFLHTGKPRSFVFDVADIYKFETVVPVAMRIAAKAQRGEPRAVRDPSGEVRRGCRDSFRRTKLLRRIIPEIDQILAAGGHEPPPPHPEAQPIAFEEKQSGDVGHRG